MTHANQTEPREHDIIEHVEERGSVYGELYDLKKEGEVRRYSLSRFIVMTEWSRRLNPDDVLPDPCVLEIELHKIEVKSHRVASVYDSPGLEGSENLCPARSSPSNQGDAPTCHH